jgi:phenylpropionate dioxygenase-like ring-hydroxylating dioxygenase large terminal subunit
MMNQEQNDLITRIGPNTPCGRLMRNYWQPAALTAELADSRPIKAVRLLGEEFVLFRDEAGRLGLMDRDCPHRGADLAFGRLENGGLRCAFHGWLFDAEGKCLETPAEPANSPLCQNIRQRAYPVVERSGILWAYLGEGEPPAFPETDCFVAPGAYTFAFKGLMECNWLQALEVGIDPAHASFLRRFFEDEDTSASYGKQFRAKSAGSDLPMTRILREYDRPILNVERTEYGLRLIALRQLNDEQMHVRVTNQLFPHAFVIPMSAEMTITQWHVPVDDENCYWYAIFTSYAQPADKQKMRDQRPDYRSRRNRANDYGFDPHARAPWAIGQGHHSVPAAPARADRKGSGRPEADALPRRHERTRRPGSCHHGRHWAGVRLGNVLDGGRRQASQRRALDGAGSSRDRGQNAAPVGRGIERSGRGPQ